MRWLLTILLLCAPAALHGQSQCPSPGNTGTTDGTLVSYACGPANPITTACPASALSKYGSSSTSNLPGQVNPCMDRYYNTADGVANSNVTIVIARAGANQFANSGLVDWAGGMEQTNGTAPSIINSLVDGTAVPGKHFNVDVVYFGLFAWGQLHANSSIGATSAQVDVGGTFGGAGVNSKFWPNATGYTVYIGSENGGTVGTQTGTWGSGGNGSFTITWTNSLSNTHTAGENIWAAGSNGAEAPSSPCTGQLLQIADFAKVMAYDTANIGTVPGNGHFILWGFSGGGDTVAKTPIIWKTMLGEPTPCGLASANTSGTVDGFFMLSPNTDGAVNSYQSTVYPNQVAPCTTESSGWSPVYNNSPWLQGPDIGEGTVSATTISYGATTAVGGLPVTGPNATFTLARSMSASGLLVPGGWVAQDSDGFLGKSEVYAGSADLANICAAQYNFGTATPGSSVIVKAGAGHGADFQTAVGRCTQANSCYDSLVWGATLTFLKNLYTYGNVQRGGVVSGGVVM